MQKLVTTIAALYARQEPTGEVILDAVVSVLRQSTTHSVQDVAAALDAAPRHLSGAVQILTGMSLKALIKEWRLRQAVELICREPALTDHEVARRCGYRHEDNLVLDFKRRYHTTPYIFRTGEIRRNGNYPMNESAEKRSQILKETQLLRERYSDT